MKIIELCGIPGCGKSTLVDAVLNRCEFSHISFATRNDIYFFKCKGRNKTIALIRAFLKFKNYKLYNNILRINRRYSKDIKCLKYAFQFILFYSQIQDVIKSGKYKYAVLDEGVYQYISAQADNTVFNSDEQIISVIDYIRVQFSLWSIIYCDIDIPNALKRISNRKGSSKRFSASKDVSELEKLLLDRKTNIDYLCSHKCDLVLNMNSSIEENVIRISNIIDLNLGGR